MNILQINCKLHWKRTLFFVSTSKCLVFYVETHVFLQVANEYQPRKFSERYANRESIFFKVVTLQAPTISPRLHLLFCATLYGSCVRSTVGYYLLAETNKLNMYEIFIEREVIGCTDVCLKINWTYFKISHNSVNIAFITIVFANL